MVELRKRAAPPPAPPPAKKKSTPKAKTKKDAAPAVESKLEAPVESKPEPAVEAPAARGGVPKTGDSITLEGFGGEVETNDENKVTLAKLVADSKAGVVLFTYPKASTPGCKCKTYSLTIAIY